MKKEEHGIHLNMSQNDFGTLCICAIRYCHGRKTYMPDLVRGIVRSNIGEISTKDLQVMISDCDFQRSMKLYGDPKIDKPGWLEWEKYLHEELVRRVESETR